MLQLVPTSSAVFLLLIGLQFGVSEGQHCRKNCVPIDTVLSNTQMLSCATEKSDGKYCTLMHHLRKLAEQENRDLGYLLDRVTVAVITDTKLANEIWTGWNTSLEVQTTKHLAFLGATSCSSDGAELCKQIRHSCKTSDKHDIFLLSGYCSETITCTPIGSHIDKNGKPSMPTELLAFLAFRLLERQLFIAKELEEIRVSISSKSEYLVQNEIQEVHGSHLLEHGTPVAIFATWPIKSSAYYHMFSMFLDSALTLGRQFSFHVIDTRLSRIEAKLMRPFYRYELEDHQAFLGLYTKRRCKSKSDWPFSCKPAIATADYLLTAQQFSGFLLHKSLIELSIKTDNSGIRLPHPSFTEYNQFMKTFVKASDSFVLVVVKDTEELLNPLQDWERLKDLTINLGALFGLTFYPIIANKSLAVNLLADINTGIELSGTCERLCYIIRMPASGYEFLDMYDPMMRLEEASETAINQNKWYHESARLSQENLLNFDNFALPRMLTDCGHFAGDCNSESGSSDKASVDKEPMNWSHIEGQTDAFVEQSKFNEVYNTTGVLIIDRSKEALDNFLVSVGVDKPWLVLFTVPWSPLCKAARAIWSAVDNCVKKIGLHDIQIAKLDCFEGNEQCKFLEIDTYPTIAMFTRGKKISTYNGPIAYGRLCAYANLAQAYILESQSGQSTRALLDNFVPLVSRAFVFRGSELPDSLVTLATEDPFKEVFITESLSKTESQSGQFSAFYHDTSPATKKFKGDINDVEAVRNFIASGHLDLIFPCNWVYLPQALNSSRSLVILFHINSSMDEYQTLLDALGSRFISTETSVCHVPLKQRLHLDDLVQRIAGHNLPALVILSSDRSVFHRLHLGPIPVEVRVNESIKWVAEGLSGGLTGGQKVESLEPWKPAHEVHNFVEQVYDGKPGDDGSEHGPGAGAGGRFGGQPIGAGSGESATTDYVIDPDMETSKISVDAATTGKSIHEEL